MQDLCEINLILKSELKALSVAVQSMSLGVASTMTQGNSIIEALNETRSELKLEPLDISTGVDAPDSQMTEITDDNMEAQVDAIIAQGTGFGMIKVKASLESKLTKILEDRGVFSIRGSDL